MPGMRYQPQGLVQLNRECDLLIGAQAVVIGSSPVNLVTGVPLTIVGSAPAKSVTEQGIADSFRKTYYLATELLPAIGTAPFVEFWVGYPNSSKTARGHGNEAGFLVGSSNNNTGIAQQLGQRTESGYSGTTWGAVTNPANWGNTTSAGEVLDPDVLTVLVVARYRDRYELWRDGILRRTILRTPGNITASKMLLGTFIEDVNYWSIACDTVLSGRILNEWSTAQIVSFSGDWWQVAGDPDDDYFAAAKARYSLGVTRASLALGGGQVGVKASRRLRAASTALAVSAGQLAMRAARRLRVQPAAFTALAGPVRLQLSRRLGVQPAAMALAGQGVALRAGRRLAVAPMALALAGRAVGMQYNPIALPGSYTLSVSAAAMQLSGRSVGMRISRRLAVAPAKLQVAAGAVRVLVGRRVQVAGVRLEARGGSVTLRYSAAAPPFDITKIHPSRVVIFEGSGSRVTPFEGSGSRVTPFDGSGSRVTPFEGSGSRVTRFE